MGTKKGQVRKTARRAYTPRRVKKFNRRSVRTLPFFYTRDHMDSVFPIRFGRMK